MFWLTALALALSPFLQHVQVGSGGGGGGGVNRLHLTSNVRAIKFGLTFACTFFQDVLHVCSHHVRNLKHNFLLALASRFIASVSSFVRLVTIASFSCASYSSRYMQECPLAFI